MNLPATSETRALLGRRVRVHLGDHNIVTGLLLGFGEGGDFEILDEGDDTVHYCWPMLSIVPAPLPGQVAADD